MSDERRYAAVEVIGKARGMNQAGWEGAISDAEATKLYNMGTTIDGEWAKRKGYVLRKAIAIATAPVAKLYWKTDTITDQANGARWVQSANGELTQADSGALSVSESYLAFNTDVTIDGDVVKTIECNDTRAYIEMVTAFNFDKDAGRLKFSF